MRVVVASRRGVRGVLPVVVIAVLVTLGSVGGAAAAQCDEADGDAFAVAALVVDARAACSCESFASRQGFRDCVRAVVDGAIGGGTLPRRCRGAAMRFARKSTCGAGPAKVVCCKAGGGCGLAASEARCAEMGGGTGQVGNTESCYDACAPLPTPTPHASPTAPTPAVCCACGCRPPYYVGCSGTHQCSAPLPGATSGDQCDALDDEWKDCAHFFVTCGGDSGGILFPLCN